MTNAPTTMMSLLCCLSSAVRSCRLSRRLGAAWSKPCWDNRIDLPNLVPLLKSIQIPGEPLSGTQRLIYELDRVNPAFKIFLRYCEADHTIGSGTKIKQGDWIGAMAIAANLDECAFEKPTTFSLDPYLPGPKRPAENYLLFGAGRQRTRPFLLGTRAPGTIVAQQIRGENQSAPGVCGNWLDRTESPAIWQRLLSGLLQASRRFPSVLNRRPRNQAKLLTKAVLLAEIPFG